MYNAYLDLSAEVAQALANQQPVVALESTIISHGMPYPKNVETALRVEAIIRAQGAVPATIAILKGRLKAGLNREELEQLGKAGTMVTKCSRRDLPFVISQQLDGATTVAATMIIASMAGIPIFATGGIGGVHRGGASSMDISADLQELAKTNVAVVCAGAKAILDLQLTMEYLETQGVAVIGYQTNELPAFFSRKSGVALDYRMDSAEELANFLHTKSKLQLSGGVVIANPISEADELPLQQMNTAVEQALQEAEEQGIRGKENTPFLLSRIEQLTGGDSLASNIKLVCNNAALAAKVAVALTQKNKQP